MIACLHGHLSVTTDYCDVCGAPLSDAVAARAMAAVPVPRAATGPSCDVCSEPRDGRFCETCGHDSDAQASSVEHPTARWVVTVSADREYFDRVVAGDGPDVTAMRFPQYCPERRFTLHGTQVQIGRRSRRRGHDPAIDLTGPPLDPGVSHLHALLVAVEQGWALVDVQSTNGITVNGCEQAIERDTPVLLTDGDRVHLGAWTTMTLSRA